MHRGKYVEKAIRNSGISISKVAQKLGTTRQNMYNYFNNEKLDIEIINSIAEVIKEPEMAEKLLQMIMAPEEDTSSVVAEAHPEYDNEWEERFHNLEEQFTKVNSMFTQLLKENARIMKSLTELRETLVK
jgi:predicted transcriptional regulator